jgi:RND family efflux transporter MFP subunit
MRSQNVAAAAAAVAAISAFGCNAAPAGGPPGGMAFPPTTVKVEPARPSPIEDANEYIGVLKSLRSTAIQPQADGQITRIYVTSGQRVAEGAVLVQIDPRRQQAAVLSQEAERQARDADVGFARRQVDRSSELFKAGAISKQELETAQTALQTAEAQLQALQAQVQQQQVQLRYYTVTAPTAGTVGDVPVRVGNMVTPQTVLTTIDQNATLEVQVQVPVERSSVLKIGLPIQVLSHDGEDEVATTRVTFVSPQVEDQTQSVLVKGILQNPNGLLRSSQHIRARIVWKTAEGLVVPVTAVLRVSGQYFAFVAEESKGPDGKPALVARQRPITVGPISGNNYPVLSGLKPDEPIVVSGVQKLADGAPIVAAP